MRRRGFIKSVGALAMVPLGTTTTTEPSERRARQRRADPPGRIPTTPIECEHGYDLCPTCDAEIMRELHRDMARRLGRRAP